MAGNLYRSRGTTLRTAFLLPYFSWLSNFVTIPCQYRIVSRFCQVRPCQCPLPIVYDWFVVQASSASSHASRWVFAVFNVIPAIIKYLHSFFCPFSFSGAVLFFAVCLVSLAEPRKFLWLRKHSSGSPGLHFSCGRRLLYATQNGRPFF